MSSPALPTHVKGTEAVTRPRQAPRYKVLFHNDEVTTMEFVIGVLQRFFGHDFIAATTIMLEVHHTGLGLAGTYPFEIAELKRDQTVSAARPHFPLAVTLEPDE
jgi:ATP-dependent Clp protease adaptor protein ClpS